MEAKMIEKKKTVDEEVKCPCCGSTKNIGIDTEELGLF